MKQHTRQPEKARTEKQNQNNEITIRFFAPVPSNERHPLANVDPETRNAERQRVIARVLARLAEAAADISSQNGTMKSKIRLFRQTECELEAGSQNEAN